MAKKKVDLKKIADGIRLVLEGIGEDPSVTGSKKRPSASPIFMPS